MLISRMLPTQNATGPETSWISLTLGWWTFVGGRGSASGTVWYRGRFGLQGFKALIVSALRRPRRPGAVAGQVASAPSVSLLTLSSQVGDAARCLHVALKLGVRLCGAGRSRRRGAAKASPKRCGLGLTHRDGTVRETGAPALRVLLHGGPTQDD